MNEDGEIVGMDEFVNALQEAIESSNPAKRKALADTLEAYGESFPDIIQWATGAQAPALLWNIMHAVSLGAYYP